MCHVPLEGEKKNFENRKDAVELFGNKFGSHIPPSPEGEWKVCGDGHDVTSDLTLTRLFFYGIGAARVVHQSEEDGGGYTVDLDPLSAYPVIPGYVRYQGKVFFDKNAEVTQINCLGQTVYPTDGYLWEFAKFLVRTSALTAVTAYEHLIQAHLIWANITTNATVINLSPDHPLRRLLHIHTYRTAFINKTAVTALTPHGGILNRMFSFPHDTLVKVLDDSFTSFNYYTFPELIKSLNMENVDGKIFPMAEDGMDYWKIVYRYVHDYVHLFYDDTYSKITHDAEVVAFWTYLQKDFPNGLPELTIPNLVEYITQFIHYVSGMHIHAGNDSAYARDPAFTGTIVKDGTLIQPPQCSYTQTMLIVATVGKMPQMTEDFSHLLPANAQGVWKVFNSELVALSNVINERNTSRPWVFNSMNPSHLVTSVAT